MRRAAASALIALACVVSACGITDGVRETTLPGGADVGESPITVTAEFADVLDLVPQSSVKLDHVDVGRVTAVELSDDAEAAVVTMEIRSDLDLSADTSARVEQTSLLGEKYVALVRGSAPQQLADGDAIGRSLTSRAVGAEEVLGALSALLTGGGLSQFQTISRELQAVGGGRTDEIRAFLEDIAAFVETLDDNRDSIVEAIDGMGDLSTSLADNRTQIDAALTGLGPGVESLADQRADLVRMLAALDRLSAVTVRTIDRAGEDLVADFRALAPVLTRLAQAGDALPTSLELLATFPFSDAVLEAVKGDYFNLFVVMRVRDTATSQPVARHHKGVLPPLMIPESAGGEGRTSAPEASPSASPTPGATPTTPEPTPSAEASPEPTTPPSTPEVTD